MRTSALLVAAVAALSACSPGEVDYTHKTCVAPTECPDGYECQQGACQKKGTVAEGCKSAADCPAPGPCQVAGSAQCVSGACQYQTYVCAQQAPFQPCLQRAGTCNPAHAAGCQGAGCCEFPPAWTPGSERAVPACPLAGQDPDSDGELDVGETWGGMCTGTGDCVGCTANEGCDDQNPCTADTCDPAGSCKHDPLMGDPCTLSGDRVGYCTQDPSAPRCVLGVGSDCTDPLECDSNVCAQGVCCSGPCGGSCESCAEPGSRGACTPVAAKCTGSCSACIDGNCQAAPAACGGTCSHCVGAGTDFRCEADASVCQGDCVACLGAGASFNCVPLPQVCQGACAACQGGGTTYNCGADQAKCPPSGPTACTTCTAAANVFSCTQDLTQDADCGAGQECSAPGVCLPGDGQPCTSDSGCASGHCVALMNVCASRYHELACDKLTTAQVTGYGATINGAVHTRMRVTDGRLVVCDTGWLKGATAECVETINMTTCTARVSVSVMTLPAEMTLYVRCGTSLPACNTTIRY